MKTSIPLLLAVSALCAAGNVYAEEGRFDAQVFRPAAAPRDLVMVQKSEVIGHFSPTVGFYYDVALNPLELVVNDTGRTMDAVAARLQLTALAGMGFFDLFDVSLAMPFIAWQSSDNLRTVGTEGKIETPALGDLRISTKYTIPYLNRKEEFKEGFGMAVAGNVNLPTGNENAFTSDGVVTGGVTLITDYRFNFGLILATNLGLWLRPDTQFAGVRIGNMAQFGVAAEMYVVQRWGLSVIGEVYGYPSLTSFPDSPKQVPAEALLGIRWQTKHGITITFGGSFGAACGFGSPAVRFFNGITWQPKNSREQEHINRLLLSGSGDRDDDGVDDADDRCPYMPGPPEDLGCPNIDSDNDGVLDRDDECPSGKVDPYSKGKMGCPSVYIADEQIVVLKPIYFARDKDIILDESKLTLDDIARVLKHHPEVREIVIEGHTDSRAGISYNMNLSQRRVHKVMAALVARGVEPARMTAKGYGQSELEYDDSTCTMPDEELTPDCRFMMSKNQRIVFGIKRIGVVPPRPLTGAPGEGTLPFEKRILPYSGDGVLPRIFRNKSGEVILPYPMRKELEKKLKPNSVRKKPGKKLKPKPVRQEESKPNPPGTLPKSGVLKKTKDGVLGSGSVLPSSSTKDPAGGQGLKKEGVLPSSRGVLPRSGTPEAAPPSAPTPPSKGTAPEPAPKGSATPPPPPVFE